MLRIEGATFLEKALLKRVEKATFEELGQKDFFETSVSIVDAKTIRSVNNETRGTDRVTDVLSFPYFEGLEPPVSEEKFSDADREGDRVLLGYMLICRERALEQAKELGHSYRRELGFLLCHGLMHLMGFDHVKSEDEEIMTAHQRAVMDRLKLKL